MSQEKHFWGIGAGRDGEATSLFENKSIVAMGWKQLSDLSKLETREDFKDKYAQTYPEVSAGAVRIHAGILFRFIKEMKEGDIVVFRNKRRRELWLGEVVGDYEYRPEISAEWPHTKKVKWLKQFPRQKFSQGALYEIGAAMTFFLIRNYVEEFVAALEGVGTSEYGQAIYGATTYGEEQEAIDYETEELEQRTIDYVLKQISQKLKGHGLSDFVGHLLNIMGYNVKVSPPGPDHGVDIEAYKDDLGVEPPIIKAQVKSNDNEIGEPELQKLLGSISEKSFGVFVALNGFNSRALSFARGKNNLRLIDGLDLVNLIYKHYDKLDSKYKGMIPLKHVYVPESLSE